MKFLHVFDTGGFSAHLAKFDTKNQHDILQLEHFDPFGFSKHYGNTRLFPDAIAVGTFPLDAHKPDDDKRTYILDKKIGRSKETCR